MKALDDAAPQPYPARRLAPADPPSPGRCHFAHLAHRFDELFVRAPQPVEARASAAALGWGLGAALYIPATRPQPLRDLQLLANAGLVTAIFCLEDAVADHELERATAALVEAMSAPLTSTGLPLVFLRVRDPDHLEQVLCRLGEHARKLCGFVLAKFRAADAGRWFTTLERCPGRLLAMPVVEGPEVLWTESRASELAQLATIMADHRDQIVAIRVGGTDLCGLLGLRPAAGQSIYELTGIAACLADITNVLGRPGGPVISAPVHESYACLHPAGGLESEALLCEVVRRDRASGFVGKTVIHPAQALVVEAHHAVTATEWADAVAILDGPGGAFASADRTRMNEARPHTPWAERTLRLADVFGVLRPGVQPDDLLRS